MAWECAECNAREADNSKVRINTVCHHCGKPLCQKDRTQLIDNAFSSEDGPLGRTAFHCRSCKRAHHPGPTVLMERN